MSDAVRAEKIAHEVDYAARQLAQAGRLDLTHEFIQHGDVTVYAHVTSVARASLSFAEHLGRVGISVDRASLLRGGRFLLPADVPNFCPNCGKPLK